MNKLFHSIEVSNNVTCNIFSIFAQEPMSYLGQSNYREEHLYTNMLSFCPESGNQMKKYLVTSQGQLSNSWGLRNDIIKDKQSVFRRHPGSFNISLSYMF